MPSLFSNINCYSHWYGTFEPASSQFVKKQSVLTTKPLEDREFQFVYLCSLLSNFQFIRQQNDSKLQ